MGSLSDFMEDARLEYFFLHSLSRRLRKKMARELKVDFHELPPYNKPMDFGINKFKRSLRGKGLSRSQRNRAVVIYKERAYRSALEAIDK